MAPLKILACGSINGNFSKFLKRTSSIQKKNGPFEMVICTGDFFNSTDECKSNWKTLKKTLKADVPVYILGPTSKELEEFYSPDKLKDGEDLAENVLYLGHKGIFKTTSGLVIAYISGSETTTSCCKLLTADVTSLIEQAQREDQFRGVDVLVTSLWPRNVTKFTKSDIKTNGESSLLSSLATALKPRYHLSCHPEKFYERTPYRNHQVLQQDQQHVSRFISIAPFNNTNNEKSIYAFSITPMSHLSREELVKQPDDVTEFPYKDVANSSKPPIKDENKEQQQFFFRQEDLKRKSDFGDRPRKVAKGPPPLSTACWFCLGSKDVEKHLVVSVGEHCYIALAKGALNKDHVLICPVAHHNSTVVLPDEARLEMEKYKDGLRKMFEKENKVLVTFERNFYTQHLQLQVCGVPDDLSEEISDTFQDLASSNNMELFEIPKEKDISQMVAITTPYFTVEAPNGVRLLHKVKSRMNLQFGREVLASPSLLNLPHRVDWKKCKLTKDEETQQAKEFRKRFQPFDFNF